MFFNTKQVNSILFGTALIFFSFNFLQAQDFESYELTGGEDDGVNVFLQEAISQDNALKTKAEIFNGKRSGVYEGEKLACPYAFERDLSVGSKGEDVRLLQVLLNSDKRTLIAVSGPGSLGQESDSFGEATKEAVKKFQALFIEYTGVANGRFGPRTRTVMNAICNGENKPSTADSIEARQNRNIYENIFSVQRGAVPGGIAVVGANGDTVPPRISLSANVSTVKFGDNFKIILNSSEEIVPITPDSIIVDGGSVKEIRKLSKTSYTISINIEDGVKNVMVQVEADKIEDLAGNKNENASNEISVKVVGGQTVASSDPLSETEPSINSLLDKIISSAPQCTYNGSGILVTVGPDGKQLNTSGCAQTQSQNLAGSGQTYNCNGQMIPITQPCQNQQTQTVCTTSVNPLTGMPQQQCQQMTQQQAAAAQQAQQDQQFGQMLGSLLRQGFGQGQNGQGSGLFGGSGGGGSFGGGGSVSSGLPGSLPGQVSTEQRAQIQKDCEIRNSGNPQAVADCVRDGTQRVLSAGKSTASQDDYSNLSEERRQGELNKTLNDIQNKNQRLEELINSCQSVPDQTKCRHNAEIEKLNKEIDDLENKEVRLKNPSIESGEVQRTRGTFCKYITTDGIKLLDNSMGDKAIHIELPDGGFALDIEGKSDSSKSLLEPKEAGKTTREQIKPGDLPYPAPGRPICYVGSYKIMPGKAVCFEAVQPTATPDEKKSLLMKFKSANIGNNTDALPYRTYLLVTRKTNIGIYMASELQGGKCNLRQVRESLKDKAPEKKAFEDALKLSLPPSSK